MLPLGVYLLPAETAPLVAESNPWPRGDLVRLLQAVFLGLGFDLPILVMLTWELSVFHPLAGQRMVYWGLVGLQQLHLFLWFAEGLRSVCCVPGTC